MLDLELTVLDGPYKGRKFWHNLLLVGTTDGQKKMAAGNLGVLKAILDSALGLKPNDVSAEARAARTVSVKWFEGMNFIAKIGDGEGRAQEGRQRKLCRTRTSSPALSPPIRPIGIRSSSRLRLTAAEVVLRRRPLLLQRRSSGRSGRGEKDTQSNRTGLSVRDRRSVAAGRHRCRYRSCTTGYPGWTGPFRLAHRSDA